MIKNQAFSSMQYIIVFLIFVTCIQPLSAQKTKSNTLLDFSRERVSQDEFERVYQKNNGGYEEAKKHSPQQYREYLDLYIKFKRKVFEAEDQKIDQSASFQQEFEGYRKQLVQPYMNAKDVEDLLIREAYDRSKLLVSADHILITLQPEATPSDTLTAYNYILSLRDSIVNHKKSFSAIAEKYSQDPSAKTNKGRLGYFSAFDMVYPFESAAFSTEVGQVSLPVRTSFGYHLVRVNEKLPSGGIKKAAHIMVRIGDRYTAKDTSQAIAKINEIYDLLQKGEDFAALARRFSDDAGSAPNGGDLGTTRLIPAMEEQRIKLDLNEFSKPFNTSYGWHILKVTEVQPVPDFEASIPTLKQKISRDTRSQLGKVALIRKIKQEYGYKEFPENLASFSASLGNTFSNGNWKADSTQTDLYNKALFQINGQSPVLIKDLITYYEKNRPRNTGLSPAKAAEMVKENFSQEWLINYEEGRLPLKNPDFAYLLKEYRDGILLFTLMEQKVWKKAVEDTLGLKNYYDTHTQEFYAEGTMDVAEYIASDPAVLQEVKTLLSQGQKDAYIDSVINQGSTLTLRIIVQNFEKGKPEMDAARFDLPVGNISDIIEDNGIYKIQVIKEKFPAGIKPYEKSKAECITRYQDFLEQSWLKELENKYPVKINEKAFKVLFKR